jgi:hypothetical protein
MRRLWVVVMSGVVAVFMVVGLYFAVGGPGPAARAGEAARVAVPAARVAVPAAQVAVPAADSPSVTPSLGSTPQTGVNGPGPNDGDPNDFNRLPLVFGALIILVLLLGGSGAFFAIRRRRRQHQ